MKYIKHFLKFKESLKFDFSISEVDMNESLSIWYDALLDSIGAQEVDIFDTFSLPKDDYIDNLDIEYLSNNIEFINSLSSIGLKKSGFQNSNDFETFINKPCRFMMIYNIESNELENPSYLLIQSYNETLEKWENSKLYKINGEIDRFYNKLSSKTIELTDEDGKNYIYNTTNKNEWTLQNSDKSNNTFKKYFRSEEINNLIKEKKLKVKII